MSKIQRIGLLALISMLAVLVLTACGTNQDSTTSSSSNAAENVGKSSGADASGTGAAGQKSHLNVALFWLGSSLDPAEEWNGWTLARAAIGETLIQFDEHMKMVPKLADKWERIDDTTWHFHIREGVTFHNGNPVTADAVKKSIERSLSLNERGPSTLPIASMTAKGQELTIQTTEPDASLLGNIAEPLFIIVDTSADTSKFKSEPIATGPFMVTGYTPDQEIKVKKYDGYWGGAADLDTMTLKYIKDDSTRALALQSGEIDVASNIGRSSMSLFQDKTQYTIDEIPSLRTQFVWFNTTHPLLSDVKVRRAISYGIDREMYASTLVGGQAAKGPFTSALPFGYDKITGYNYEPAKAKQLLDEAGYKDTDGDGIREKNGKKLSLQLILNSAYESDSIVATAMQSQLKEIGVGLELTSYEDLTDHQKSGNYDLALTSINTGITGDPQYILDFYFKTGAEWNIGGYSNPKLDDIIQRLHSQFDVEKRYALAAEAQQLILNDAAYMFVTYTPINIVSKSNVKGATMYPIDFYLLDRNIKVEQ
ncbi:ABC transporter substrate-binding protein [Paenibacillus barcinonensis]|uniref:ABC transporter substrate-binding protein n=1 Tax=Paenibacillus barcinonensis TaxID=198119 RepID=A0A2V4W9U3_PAEBA|nr:ABC transporter substrate-binding protein [Paenibacillus barcinonensis]PYE44404.1 peptide/nickel transport system substrate-binding protein [Paenibacillus barcinonensis]QKS58061.1 ABC transporter substrate-binding protein [Paenibacillus barcinonensis]